ncbi:MAG: GNAT family N-acetyltransferase [Cephaloticoccus sp.]|nr:GNAT family N-acetyltransferase [Cephaloticoccus sp.]MCF7759628.1 GNAT family N-acetyltransferase [Cephaloticoccus sp.]
MSSPSPQVSLREITADTVRSICTLVVAPGQEKFVASNAVSIAQAYFEPKAWFRAIHAGDTPVGFVMLSLDPTIAEYAFWRFMIDAKHQQRGYGMRALELVLAHVRTLPNATAVLVSCVPGEGSPQAFYERAGFRPTGAIDDGEVVLRLDL